MCAIRRLLLALAAQASALRVTVFGGSGFIGPYTTVVYALEDTTTSAGAGPSAVSYTHLTLQTKA